MNMKDMTDLRNEFKNSFMLDMFGHGHALKKPETVA